MEYLKLCDSDYRFMTVVWDYAPINSGELAALCLKELGWKKSTTYTTIKKLCEKGYIKNENAVVSVKIPRERYSHRRAIILWSVHSAARFPGFWLHSWEGKSCRERKRRRFGK